MDIDKKITGLRAKIRQTKYVIAATLAMASGGITKASAETPQRDDNQGKNFTTQTVRDYHPVSNQTQGDNSISENLRVISLEDLASIDIMTFNCDGITFTNEDFEGYKPGSEMEVLIKRARDPRNNKYRDGVCTAAIKQKLIGPCCDITKEGRAGLDRAVRGCDIDKIVRDGGIKGFSSFICSDSQDSLYENLGAYFSCQYPKNIRNESNYGHIGFRYCNNGKMLEYRGYGPGDIVKKSKNNPYGKRTAIVPNSAIVFALNNILEQGKEAFMIYDSASHIVSVYDSESLCLLNKEAQQLVLAYEQSHSQAALPFKFAEMNKDTIMITPNTFNNIDKHEGLPFEEEASITSNNERTKDKKTPELPKLPTNAVLQTNERSRS